MKDDSGKAGTEPRESAFRRASGSPTRSSGTSANLFIVFPLFVHFTDVFFFSLSPDLSLAQLRRHNCVDFYTEPQSKLKQTNNKENTIERRSRATVAFVQSWLNGTKTVG